MGEKKKKRKERKIELTNTFLNTQPNGRFTKQPRGEDEEFLRSVEVGDIATVRRSLARLPNIADGIVDVLGRSPLRIAVENEHLEIVELLLDRTDSNALYDALLLAISLDHDEIAIIILKHPLYEKVEHSNNLTNSQGFHISNADSLFSAETTPLILAAQRNSYEIISILMSKGSKINEPHKPNCECAQCKAMREFDELRFAKLRLNAYKGLSSEAYISISSDDPILTAFEMRRTLWKMASKEKHYREDYEKLARRLNEYVVKLLNNVRGDDELDFILNEQKGCRESLDDAQHMPRLKLALQYNEKGFVTHASIQKVLTSIWYGKVHPYRHRLPEAVRPLFTFLLALAFPFLVITYWITPHTKVKNFLNIPFVKFVGQTSSFLVFLVLIVAFSFTEKPSQGVVSSLDYERNSTNGLTRLYGGCDANVSSNFKVNFREHEPGVTQVIICVFIVGLIWQECKQLYSNGLREHFDSLFNVIDFLSLSLYFSSFTLRYLCYFKTKSAMTHLSTAHLAHFDEETVYQSYWILADRYYWDAWDPIHVCEGLFAMANVMSFCRLFYLLPANEAFGPLQVSILRMIMDISRFLVIFIIVLLAFLVGLCNLYWYYEPSVKSMVELHLHDPVDTNAGQAFGNIEKTFQTVFWALFGMGDSDVVTLGDHYSVAFTQRVGYVVYGAYNVASVIILLNMLIAMMTRSFDSIQEAENIEWKFARAQLYMDYVSDSSFIPVPLNIVPSPIATVKMLKRIVMWSTCFFCRCCRGEKVKSEEEDNPEGIMMSEGNDVVFSHGGEGSTADKRDSERYNGVAYMDTINVDVPVKTKKKIKNVGKKLFAKKKAEKEKEKNEENAPQTYSSVMKRIVKRFIFESQKVESSPLEGEIEELKQDLSSVRFELMNALKTQQNTLQDSVNVVSAKLDLYSFIMQESLTSQTANLAVKNDDGEDTELSIGDSDSDLVYDREDTDSEIAKLSEDTISHPTQKTKHYVKRDYFEEDALHNQEDVIIAQNVSYGYEDNDLNKVASSSSGDGSSVPSNNNEHEESGSSIDVDDVMMLKHYKCINCLKNNQHTAQTKDNGSKPKYKYHGNYTTRDLEHLVSLLNDLPYDYVTLPSTDHPYEQTNVSTTDA